MYLFNMSVFYFQGVKRSYSPSPSAAWDGSPYHSGTTSGSSGVFSSPSNSSIKQEQPYAASEYGAKLIKTGKCCLVLIFSSFISIYYIFVMR